MWELYYCASFNKYKELKIVLQKWFLIENYFFDKRDIFMEWEFFGKQINKQTTNKWTNHKQNLLCSGRIEAQKYLSEILIFSIKRKLYAHRDRYTHMYTWFIYLFILTFRWGSGERVTNVWECEFWFFTKQCITIF